MVVVFVVVCVASAVGVGDGLGIFCWLGVPGGSPSGYISFFGS